MNELQKHKEWLQKEVLILERTTKDIDIQIKENQEKNDLLKERNKEWKIKVIGLEEKLETTSDKYKKVLEQIEIEEKKLV